ncbi:TIGR02300 family protein [Caldovatus aquaticus]|uniref:TIGR02300 family protein n=1 Tax=Caldovatus aquaticus TaxID=2865671 RepID=A0ABS7F6E5_9PROT|nr:TIGR02300 family protein [Caldovatus aquaticus]MBW8271073.1 TIGR02300 family protein [Caldovatus aquaticus]
MAKPELGLKRICVACGAKFYDLNRSPVICPKCATEQPAEQPRLRRGGGTDERLKKRAVAGPLPEGEIEEVALEDVEVEEAALEDAEELEDDTEALAEDIEVEPDRDEEV